MFADLMEVNDQGVATRRRAALNQIRRDRSKGRLAEALVKARILVTNQERAENPTIEVAHEAVFTGWRRLNRWIESNADRLRVCRSLVLAARDWQQAGASSFKHLPDRATLRQYRGIRPRCSLGEDAGVVQNFLGAARSRQMFWSGFLSLMVLAVGVLGMDIWLRSQEMNWNVLRIWSMAKVGLYDGPEMVPIPKGPFQMGSPGNDSDAYSMEFPQRTVEIKPFLMGKYEVTFDEYAAFVFDADDVNLPPDEGWNRGPRPVINVRWDDAKDYAAWLTKVTGSTFRLPTEAEWEYAARAGTSTPFAFEGGVSNLGEYAWYGDNSNRKTHPVGRKKANAWGLHDMHGNVWEWVEDDWHDTYDDAAPADGRAWNDNPRGDDRVLRGGSWGVDARACRSASRSFDWPGNRDSYVGFRLAGTVAPAP